MSSIDIYAIRDTLSKILFRPDGHPNNSRFRETYLRKNFPNETSAILDYLSDNSIVSSENISFSDLIRIFMYDQCRIPACHTCGKNFDQKWKGTDWKKYCSMSCCQNDPEVKSKMKDGQKDVDWDAVISKRESTMLDTYGVSAASQLETNRKRMSLQSSLLWDDSDKVEQAKIAREETLKEKYGVSHLSKLPDFHSKRMKKSKETKANKSKSEKLETVDKYRKSRMGDYAYERLGNEAWVRQAYDIDKRSMYDIGRETKTSLDSILYALGRAGCEIDWSREPDTSNRSKLEIEMFEFIKSLVSNAEHSIRIDRKEMDIFIPHLKLGIEFNGIYWHSEAKVSADHHAKKVKHFYDRGYRLIQIWEDDWVHRRSVVELFLKNILVRSNRIGARQTKVVNLNQKDFDLFMNSHHMQGSTKSKYRYGLEYDGNIVSAMGFNISAKNTKYSGHHELVRFANTNVNGAFQKLLKHFEREINPKVIRSFADLEIVDQDNNVYIKNNFVQTSVLSTDYRYFNNATGIREHKFGWRKPKFQKLGLDITNKTEHELALELGLLRCYDSGKIVYEKRYDTNDIRRS